jgi:hypothetical protein
MSIDTHHSVPSGQPDDNDKPTTSGSQTTKAEQAIYGVDLGTTYSAVAYTDDSSAENTTGDDFLELIDAEVAQITDDEIDEHLRRAFRNAGYIYTGDIPEACADSGSPSPRNGALNRILGPVYEQLSGADGEALNLELGCILNSEIRQIGRITPEMTEQWKLLQSAREEVLAARQEAAQILSEAKVERAKAAVILDAASQESDQSLNEAAQIVRDARALAQEIIRTAHLDAKKIREGAEHQVAETSRRAWATLFMQSILMEFAGQRAGAQQDSERREADRLFVRGESDTGRLPDSDLTDNCALAIPVLQRTIPSMEAAPRGSYSRTVRTSRAGAVEIKVFNYTGPGIPTPTRSPWDLEGLTEVTGKDPQRTTTTTTTTTSVISPRGRSIIFYYRRGLDVEEETPDVDCPVAAPRELIELAEVIASDYESPSGFVIAADDPAATIPSRISSPR